MSKRVRCRCPLCGMLVTQEQLNGEHEFLFKIQETGSRGRGKIYHVYREPNNVEGEAFLAFELGLVQKLRNLADRLFASIESRAEKMALEAAEVDADYEWVIPPVEIVPVVEYEETPDIETVPKLMIETTPDVEMESETSWQDSVDVEAEAVLELLPPTEIVE